MEYSGGFRHIGEIAEERRNIILKGADPATQQGFTQVPNFLLRSKNLNSGDKIALSIILSYLWHNDHCFPGQARLAEDMGVDERTVRRHLKVLQQMGLLEIKRRGLGKTNLYVIDISARVTGPQKRRS